MWCKNLCPRALDAIYLLVIIIDKSVRHSCIEMNPRKYFVNQVTVQLIKTTLNCDSVGE